MKKIFAKLAKLFGWPTAQSESKVIPWPFPAEKPKKKRKVAAKKIIKKQAVPKAITRKKAK